MRYANSYSHIGIIRNPERQRVSTQNSDLFGRNCLSISQLPPPHNTTIYQSDSYDISINK